MKIDESSMYSCVGVAGAQLVEEISGKEDLCSCVAWFSFFIGCVVCTTKLQNSQEKKVFLYPANEVEMGK